MAVSTWHSRHECLALWGACLAYCTRLALGLVWGIKDGKATREATNEIAPECENCPHMDLEGLAFGLGHVLAGLLSP